MKDVKILLISARACSGFWRTREAALHYEIPNTCGEEERSSVLHICM
jgi:hypothetical protein